MRGSLESISLDAARAVTGSHRAAEDASNSVGEVVEAILGSLDELEMLIGVAKGEFKEESFQLPASRFVECPLGKAQRVCTSQVCVHRVYVIFKQFFQILCQTCDKRVHVYILRFKDEIFARGFLPQDLPHNTNSS